MNSASDILTRPDTIATGRSALGVDPHSAYSVKTAQDERLAELGRPETAEPTPDPAILDATASSGVEEVLAFLALKRATVAALKRARAHFGEGLLGSGTLMMLAYQIECDPAQDPVLDTAAAGLLAYADATLGAVPSTPSDEILASTRIAAELDEDDGDLELSPAALRRAAELELLPVVVADEPLREAA